MFWESHKLNHGQTAKFVKKSLRYDKGIKVLTFNLLEAARGQKHPSEAKYGMME